MGERTRLSRLGNSRLVLGVAVLDVLVLLAGTAVSVDRSGGSGDEFGRLARELGPCSSSEDADSLRVAGPNELGDVSDNGPLSGLYRKTTGKVSVNGKVKAPLRGTSIGNMPHRWSWSIGTQIGAGDPSYLGLALDFADPLGERLNAIHLSVPTGMSTTVSFWVQHPLLWRGLAAGQRVIGYDHDCDSVVVITKSVAAEAWEFRVVSDPGRSRTFGDATIGLWFSSDLPPYQWIRLWAVGKPFGLTLQARLEATQYFQPPG
ncbi:MAG: hypothetical protein QOJ92_2262 [Frankiales bacterium]|nr:hypothetical protein [Frankiales bacterium]